MREPRITTPYTQKEIDKICELYYTENMTASEVAELTGRSKSAIKQVVMRNNPYKKEDFENIASAIPPKQPSTQATMTPREMIKALYDMGYRIEDNKLVCYQKVEVKINDIINA